MIAIVFLAVLKPFRLHSRRVGVGVGAGFSPARLQRIAPWYQSQFDRMRRVAGAVVAIARDGKLAYLQAIGTHDRAGKRSR